jgi:hypothetical protein
MNYLNDQLGQNEFYYEKMKIGLKKTQQYMKSGLNLLKTLKKLVLDLHTILLQLQILQQHL